MSPNRPERNGIYVVRGLAQRPARTPWPTTVIWRWRWEFGLLGGLALIGWFGYRAIGFVPLLALATAGVTILAVLPPTRDWLHRRGRAVVVQHRIRVGCSEAALHGRAGQLPAVLWSGVTASGERLYLWAPPGVTIGDFVAERERLATACWARSVMARRHPRFAQIVMLDIVRYPRERRVARVTPPAEEGDADELISRRADLSAPADQRIRREQEV